MSTLIICHYYVLRIYKPALSVRLIGSESVCTCVCACDVEIRVQKEKKRQCRREKEDRVCAC